MWAYCDSSALIKRYVKEAGRRDVLLILRQHACVASAVLPVELRSALRRRVADSTLNAARVPSILRRVAADRAYWSLVDVGTDVLAAAEGLVSIHPLRTLDAIHIASAQLFAARMPMTPLIFVSADKRQTEAAAAVGLTVRHIT